MRRQVLNRRWVDGSASILSTPTQRLSVVDVDVDVGDVATIVALVFLLLLNPLHKIHRFYFSGTKFGRVEFFGNLIVRVCFSVTGLSKSLFFREFSGFLSFLLKVFIFSGTFQFSSEVIIYLSRVTKFFSVTDEFKLFLSKLIKFYRLLNLLKLCSHHFPGRGRGPGINKDPTAWLYGARTTLQVCFQI